ncbi:MAG: hypothetical protein GAK32_00738 [Pseudomonas fluorescens]|nr:MAG: hypothetical protein GAK32_00738 [Pseudomonas fluorescens]
MSVIQPHVIEHKPSFWSRPRLFVAALIVMAAGVGGAIYSQDTVKAVATLATNTQEPAAQVVATWKFNRSLLPPQRPIRVWNCGPFLKMAPLFPWACCPRTVRASSASTRASRQVSVNRCN